MAFGKTFLILFALPTLFESAIINFWELIVSFLIKSIIVLKYIESLGIVLIIFLLVFILIASVNFLTEITSNLATTAMLLPILYPMAMTIDVHPFILMVSAAVAASCAFMLPVATPPNAVVFGSGYLRIPDMVRVGICRRLGVRLPPSSHISNSTFSWD